jgi:Na+-translocating ferredoxin:NAD+ oxidoreductase RnfG subunit
MTNAEWQAVQENKDLWGVYYEVSDCDGTKGYIQLLVEGISEQNARIISHRMNE